MAFQHFVVHKKIDKAASSSPSRAKQSLNVCYLEIVTLFLTVTRINISWWLILAGKSTISSRTKDCHVIFTKKVWAFTKAFLNSPPTCFRSFSINNEGRKYKNTFAFSNSVMWDENSSNLLEAKFLLTTFGWCVDFDFKIFKGFNERLRIKSFEDKTFHKGKDW